LRGLSRLGASRGYVSGALRTDPGYFPWILGLFTSCIAHFSKTPKNRFLNGEAIGVFSYADYCVIPVSPRPPFARFDRSIINRRA
jgi:hypothetical protein